MSGCDEARLHYIHRRVKCCFECHEFMLEEEEPRWEGYALKLPDGKEVGVCHTVFEAVPEQITMAD